MSRFSSNYIYIPNIHYESLLKIITDIFEKARVNFSDQFIKSALCAFSGENKQINDLLKKRIDMGCTIHIFIIPQQFSSLFLPYFLQLLEISTVSCKDVLTVSILQQKDQELNSNPYIPLIQGIFLNY